MTIDLYLDYLEPPGAPVFKFDTRDDAGEAWREKMLACRRQHSTMQ